MKRKEFKTKRLILRPLKSSDYSGWLKACTDRRPKQSRWDEGPLPKKKCTRVDFNKIKNKHERLEKEDKYYWYGVFLRQSEELAGIIDFTVFERSAHQFANFGYVIYNQYWGYGYGQEAAAAGLVIGFKHLKLNRLEGAINLDNRKSIRLAKAIGMRKEGIKKRYWFEDGKWVDHLIYVANPEDLGFKAHKPY